MSLPNSVITINEFLTTNPAPFNGPGLLLQHEVVLEMDLSIMSRSSSSQFF